MIRLDVLEAGRNLSTLLQMLEDGDEDVIVIARNGQAIADLRLSSNYGWTPSFLGVKEGKYVIPDDIDADNDEIADSFGV